jgi:soluble lytic murein transglycosylase-like protein
MKLPRSVPQFRLLKLAPLTIISLFLFTNLTGIFFSHVFAPSANGNAQREIIPADVPTSGNAEMDHIIFRAGERQGVDPRFIHAVIWQESKYNPDAHSRAGAVGLMQLMPGTAKRFGCKDLTNVTSNVEAGTRYLSWLLRRFDGDVPLTLAGYNAGEGAVDKYNGVPPYSQTQQYVRNIIGRYGKAYHPVLSPERALVEFHLVPGDHGSPNDIGIADEN